MKYLHYWHFANQWYCYIDDNSEHKKIPGGNEQKIHAYEWQKDYLIDASEGLTHREIKEKLNKEYPGCILIKEIAYHQGARWHGNKNGSRK